MRNLVGTLAALFIVCMLCLVSSCGKKGCTDENARTYSSRAKKDDGTCRYEGSTVFWVSDTSAQQMLDDTIQSLTIYFDGDIVGTLTNTGQSFKVAPDCGALNAVTVKRDLFSAPTKAFSYRVLDDRSIKRFAGVVTLNGNTCEPFQLVYYP